MNVVTERRGFPAAVLIRALEPLDGLTLMQRRRVDQRRAAASGDRRDAICQGPGNLSVAMGITLAQNRTDLLGATLFFEDRGLASRDIVWTPRIGIRVGIEHAVARDRSALARHDSGPDLGIYMDSAEDLSADDADFTDVLGWGQLAHRSCVLATRGEAAAVRRVAARR